MKTLTATILLTFILGGSLHAQEATGDDSEKIESIIARAVEKLGGAKYLNATTISSRGRLSILKNQKIDSFQSFVDVIVLPDKQRTDFSTRGSKTIQVNTGGGGWIYDELFQRFGPQTDVQIEAFEKAVKTHYDYLLRDYWKGNAEMSYAGRRQASLGKRNDVIRLEFEDGFWSEYEFSDKGLPMKTVYPTKNKEGIEIPEENRYAQYILTDGILFPFIIDHFKEGVRIYRVNYVEVRINKRIPGSVFEKPENPKKIKKLKI